MEVAVVVDTNVVFASLVRSEGVNRYILTVYPEIFPFFYSQAVKDEIFVHLNELARKANLDTEEVAMAMDVIFEPMNLVTGNQLSEYVAVSEKYVHDLADAPFVACALSLKREYSEVIILTWNVSDYDVLKLNEVGIRVMTPPEFLKWVRERIS